MTKVQTKQQLTGVNVVNEAQLNAITTVFEDDEVRIRRMHGSGSKLVLVFRGFIMDVNKTNIDEFARTASESGVNHVLFISDLKNSWYSRPGQVQKITRYVYEVVAETLVSEVNSIGISMGGYGAILFAQFLPIKNVAAFGPQIAVPNVLTTRENGSEMVFADDAVLPESLATSITDTAANFFIVVGGSATVDIEEVRKLPNAANLHIHFVNNCGHHTARRIKENGLLAKIVSAMLAGDNAKLTAIFGNLNIWNLQRNQSFLASVKPRLARMKQKILRDLGLEGRALT